MSAFGWHTLIPVCICLWVAGLKCPSLYTMPINETSLVDATEINALLLSTELNSENDWDHTLYYASRIRNQRKKLKRSSFKVVASFHNCLKYQSNFGRFRMTAEHKRAYRLLCALFLSEVSELSSLWNNIPALNNQNKENTPDNSLLLLLP